MGKRSLAGLLVVNFVLLVAVMVVLTGNPQPANAQFNRAGDYLMISASRIRNTFDTVYIMDMNNGVILAVEPKPGKRELLSKTAHSFAGDLTSDRRDR
jgi:hypothetical protein